MQHKRYQRGTIERTKRASGPDVWMFRYRDAEGRSRKTTLGTIKELPTKKSAELRAESLREQVNEARGRAAFFSAVLDRYEKEVLPQKRLSTRGSYAAILGKVRARWGNTRLEDLDVFEIEKWLGELQTVPQSPAGTPRPLAKATLGHYKAFLSRVWVCGMRWGIVPDRNIMALVETRDIKRPRATKRATATVEQFRAIVADPELPRIVRVMLEVATRSGMRASEFAALRWDDLSLNGAMPTVHIQRAFVRSEIDDTKTESSEARLALPQSLVTVLKEWREEEPAYNGWVFGSLLTAKPWDHENLRKRYLKPVARKHGVPTCGWHSFRHAIRSIARDVGLPLEDQRDIMRHSDTRMTEHYGRDDMQRLRRMQEGMEKISDILDGKR